jgi:membrane protease YdiL (CAAX protease family)
MLKKINLFINSHIVLSAFLFVLFFVSIYTLFFLFTAESMQQVTVLSMGYVAVFSIWQLFISVIVIYVMRKTGVFNINDFKFKGLGKGFILAWFCVLLSIATFIMLFIQLPDNSLIVPNILHISTLIMHTLCIGIFEETLIRGLTLNLLLKKMGSSKKGILVACVIYSVFFGIAHITNFMLGDSLLEVVGRIFSTTALGLYFAVLYLRTKTLWVPILVHMLVNLSSYIFNAIVSNDVLEQMAQAPENIWGNIINRLLLTVVFLIAGFILLKKVKPNDVMA